MVIPVDFFRSLVWAIRKSTGKPFLMPFVRSHFYSFCIVGAHAVIAWRSHMGWASALAWVLGCLAVQWGAWLLLFRRLRERPREAIVPIIWIPIAAGIAIFSAPILDDDAWRFLWDGWLFSHGESPFASVPAAHFGDASLPPQISEVLDRVAYPDAPTVYGPVSQILFACAAWMSPAKLWGWKIVLIVSHTLLVALLWFGVGRANRWRVSLLAIAPPILFEFFINAHPDLPAIFLITASLVLQKRSAGFSAVFCALACTARVHAWLMVPFILWGLPWRHRLAWAACLAAIYAPWLLLRAGTEWAGLGTFSELWEFNSSFYALLQMSGLSAERARSVALIFAVAFCAVAFIRWARDGADSRKIPGVACYGALLICAPVFNPWYALWMLPFLVQAGSAWRWAWVGVPALAYITHGNLGHGGLDSFAHPAWVRLVEFTLLTVSAWMAARSPNASSLGDRQWKTQAE